MKKIKIEGCIGCGMCQNISPENFTVEDVAQIINEQVTEKTEESAENCPVGAIQIVEENNAN